MKSWDVKVCKEYKVWVGLCKGKEVCVREYVRMGCDGEPSVCGE